MTLTLSIVKELKELEEFGEAASKTISFKSDFKSKAPLPTSSTNRKLKRNLSEFLHEIDERTVNFHQIAKNSSKMRIFLGEQFIEESIEVIQEKIIEGIAIGNKIYVHKPEKKMKKGSEKIEGVIETSMLSIRTPLRHEIWTYLIDLYKEKSIDFKVEVAQLPFYSIFSQIKTRQISISIKVFLLQEEIKNIEFFDNLLDFLKIKRSFFIPPRIDLPLVETPHELKCALYPHQQIALSWMLFNENFFINNPEKPSFLHPKLTENAPYFYENISLPSNSEPFYYNRFTGSFLQEPSCINPTNGGVLADEMGLGKTITAISLILSHKKHNKTTLIVLPMSLLNQWEDEISLNCEKNSLKFYEFYQKNRSNSLIISEYDVIFITYETLLREFQEMPSIIYETHWLRIILDEAHVINRHSSKTFKAVSALKASFRWCLTGTPISNRLDDIFSYISFLKIPILNEFSEWNRYIHIYKENSPDFVSGLIKPFFMQRKKEILVLPNKKEILCEIELNRFEKELYNRVYEVNGDNVREFEKGMPLRKLLNHPLMIYDEDSLDNTIWEGIALSELKKPSSKLAKLLEFLQEIDAKAEKALIFTQFASFFPYIQEILEDSSIEYLVYKGDLSMEERRNVIYEFMHNKNICCLVCTIQSGALGLNLTVANNVFIMEPWWSPSLESQAVERVYRIGQKKEVQVVKFLCRGTVEENILEIQQKKKDMIGEVFKN